MREESLELEDARPPARPSIGWAIIEMDPRQKVQVQESARKCKKVQESARVEI